MTEKENKSEDNKVLVSLLDRQSTIEQIDTAFDSDNNTFEHINKIGSDARKYVESLNFPLLRVALVRIAEKNPDILMRLMNNFSENFPG